MRELTICADANRTTRFDHIDTYCTDDFHVPTLEWLLERK